MSRDGDSARAPRVAAIVLAAGSSSRMGPANKLLAQVAGQAIVARVVDAAMASQASYVVVVTGHEAAQVASALSGRAIALVHNPDYASGLASSLRAGITTLGSEIDAALVCLADMPWVAHAHLDALIAAFAAHDQRPICLPSHEGQRGNPVLWPARHFAALGKLVGDIGGRTLLRTHADEVHTVPMPDAGVTRDVDTPADLASA